MYTREELEADGLDSVTISPQRNPMTGQMQFAVYGHGVYEESSVLAGQYRRVFLDWFSSQEEAVKAYPWGEVQGSLLPTAEIVDRLPDCPPDWFDPGAAGEAWGEDDY
jgi:hypothetical protein